MRAVEVTTFTRVGQYRHKGRSQNTYKNDRPKEKTCYTVGQ